MTAGLSEVFVRLRTYCSNGFNGFNGSGGRPQGIDGGGLGSVGRESLVEPRSVRPFEKLFCRKAAQHVTGLRERLSAGGAEGDDD